MASVYHLLSRQIPVHIQQQYPIYCKFIEYYYRWLQTRGFVSLENVTNIDASTVAISLKDTTCDISQYKHQTITNGTALAEVVGIDDYDRIIIRYLTADAQFEIDDKIHIRANSDDQYTDEQFNALDTAIISNVESLPSAFIEHFSRLLDADQIFGVLTPNIATILRTIRQLYQSKGNEQALKYLIKAIKGIDVDIKYPWDNVLKFSDGRWKRLYSITVRSNEQYWHYVPLNMRYLRIMYNDVDENGAQRYKDVPITKIEIFAKQSENYDQSAQHTDALQNNACVIDVTSLMDSCYKPARDINDNVNQYDDFGPYWIRDEHPELGPYEIDPTTGAIIFDGIKSTCTYGRWGDRNVTPFIRFYFEEDVQVELDQEVRVIEQNQDGDDYVSYAGNVVLGVDGVNIVKPGKGWQVGQVFTASKDDVWYLYSEPIKDNTHKSITLINQDGISIEYSINKPLIGRVLTIDSNGGIGTVEILQYGDHIPEHAGKPIVVSPLFYHDSTIDETLYQATLELTYSTNPHSAGYFEDPHGFLSYNDIRIQDSYYWQQFSYDIVAAVDGSQYQSIAELLHPVGTKMFTTCNIDANLDAALEFDIHQTYPFVSISLFDIAYVTETLEKAFIKSIHEEISISEFLAKTLTKVLSEQITATDGHHDNTIQYQLELNYDSGRDQYKWIERTVDSQTKAKTSYADSGFIKLVHVNYDYHIDDDFPQNPEPEKSKGGYITVNQPDGITFVSPIESRFYNYQEPIELSFVIDDETRYSYEGCTIFDSANQVIKSTFNYDRETKLYTLAFTMPDDDVVVNIVGKTLRYRITTNPVLHGTITPSQIIGFEGDVITVDVVPENEQWALESLYYYTETLGTVYITDTKKFVIPDQDVQIGATFVSNGGYIHVENIGGGTVTWNVDINKFIKSGTQVTFKIVDDNMTTFKGAQIIQDDGILLDIINNTFVMPNYDVMVRFNFIKQTRNVLINNLTGTSQENGNGQGKGTFYISPDVRRAEVGTELHVFIKPATSHDDVKFIRKIENGVTTDLQNQDTIVVGNYDITIEYAFDRTGGYIKPGTYMTNEFLDNIECNQPFNQWIPADTPIILKYRELEGYTFDEWKRTITDYNFYRKITEGSSMIDTQLTKMPRYDVILDKYTYITNVYTISVQSNKFGTIEYSVIPGKASYGPESPTTDFSRSTLINDKNVWYNSFVQVTATPIDDRHILKTLNYAYGENVVDITSTKQFYMPAGNVTINAEFIQNKFDVTINQTVGGTITLSPSKSSYMLGDVVQVIPSADLNYELRRIRITKSNGKVVDITNSSSFVVDDDVTVEAMWIQSSYTLTINPPQSGGAINDNDGYLSVLKSTRIDATYNNGTIKGPTYGQTSIKRSINAGTSLTISFVTIEVDNPQLEGVKTTSSLNSVKTSDNTLYPDLIGNISLTMPMHDITITPLVNKKLYGSPTIDLPVNYFEFVAAKDGSNVSLFTNTVPSSWKVLINGSTTNQSANLLTFVKGDTVRINYDSTPCIFSAYRKDYFVTIKGALPISTSHNLSRCFYNCISLTSIPNGLFDNNPNVTVFSECFSGCKSLTSIPKGLFDHNPNVTNFGSCFNGCESLTSIPEGLFANNPKVTDFRYCFDGCSSLTSIPKGLFANNPNVTNFRNCFWRCNSLTSVPAGLFDNNPNAIYFEGCFRDCSSLTSVPEGLFDNNPNVTDFSSCFRGCESLTSVPARLFDNNPNVTDFSDCFWNCDLLIVKVHIGSEVVTTCAYFANSTKSKGTVYVPRGSTTATTFKQTTDTNVNVIEE